MRCVTVGTWPWPTPTGPRSSRSPCPGNAGSPPAGRRERPLGPDRYIESRFEELIDDTESSVGRLCVFLDLPFDPQMLTYYERAGDIVSTTAVPDRHKDIFLPPTKGLRDWRLELSDDQVARFEALAGNLLTDLGYERKFEKVPMSARNAALRQVVADGGRVRRAQGEEGGALTK